MSGADNIIPDNQIHGGSTMKYDGRSWPKSVILVLAYLPGGVTTRTFVVPRKRLNKWLRTLLPRGEKCTPLACSLEGQAEHAAYTAKTAHNIGIDVINRAAKFRGSHTTLVLQPQGAEPIPVVEFPAGADFTVVPCGPAVSS